MSHFREPRRGATFPAGAYTLDGLERLRGYGRGLWPSTPLHHLVGIRSTQASNGSAVASVPVTGWLAHPDGVIEIGFFTSLACGLAAYTIVPPRSWVLPLQDSYAPVRMVHPQTRTLVGRSHVVRSSPDWAYVEGTVEDDQGRIVADISAHVKIAPVSITVPDEPPPFERHDPPRYPSPDPYQRPVPADRYAGIEEFRHRGCVNAMHAIMAGDLPVPPLYELLGIRPVKAAEGAVTTELTMSPWLEGVDPGPAPWALSALASDACGAVMWSLVPTDAMPAILQSSLTHLAAVPADGRRVVARAHGERAGDLLLTTVDVWDGDSRVATGITTGRLIPRRRAPTGRGKRVLASVLFTDIVRSTEQAMVLGDADWGRLLSRHHELVETEVAEYDGRVVKTTGDGVLATFESPTRAVECARSIRDAVGRLGVEIRAGVHTGECEVAGGDVAGIAVHTAARVEAAAAPGEVWVSDTTRALTAGSGLPFDDMGEHELKGIDEPVRLHRLLKL